MGMGCVIVLGSSEPSSGIGAEARGRNSHGQCPLTGAERGKVLFCPYLPLPFKFLSNRNPNCLRLSIKKEEYKTIWNSTLFFQSERMEDQLLSSNQENVYESPPKAVYCWWRSAAKFDEYTNLGIQKVTPRLKVLREMERLALVAPEGLDELRQKLFNYSCGDFWVPTGGIKKEEMDINSSC